MILVWERTCNAILVRTNWQCYNEARVDGKGPVVAAVSRKGPPACQRVVVRLGGKLISEFAYMEPQSMLEGERVAEEAFAGGVRP